MYPQQLAPDQGMRQLATRLARTQESAAADAADPLDEDSGLSAEVQVFGRLAIALGRAVDEMRRNRGQLPWEVCHKVPLNPIQLAAAGTVADERWGPATGWIWHITRISVQSLAVGGATLVLAAEDSVLAGGAYNLQSFPPVGVAGAAGSFLGCWEPKGKFLQPGTRLVFTATGGGAIINGEAVEIKESWFPNYLM